MEELASRPYLLAHSSPKEGRHETNDASSRPVYPILVPESRLCAVQPSRGGEHRASLLDGQAPADRTAAVHGLYARVLDAGRHLAGPQQAARRDRGAAVEVSAVGGCDEGTADSCGVDIKTVHRFQRVAAPRAQAHHEQVTRDLEVKGVQVDEMHSKRRGPRVEWLHTAIAMSSRFLLWVHWGPRTQESAALLIAQVVARLCRVPVWLSDGWKAYPVALLQVLGRVYQRCRRGTRGRHPKPRLVPPRELFYGQVVKVRDATGNLLHVVSRVVYGGPRRFFREMERRGLGATIHTAFMERWYGTLRGLCAPLRRRTRCGSSSQSRHHARVWLLVDLYNFVLPHKSLRQQGQPRTPAMVIGLAAHVWSYRDYIWYPVHPDPLGRQLMQQRVKALLIPALQAG